MPVDPINRLPNYQISQSSEANDEERRREKEERTGTSKKAPTKKTTKKEFKVDSTLPPIEQNVDTEISSQLVDSGKVVELLSHAPKVMLHKGQNPFNSVNKLNDKKEHAPTFKKLNKAL